MKKGKVISAKLYRFDGTVEDVLPANGKKFKDGEINKLLEVEIIGMVYLQEEGLPDMALFCDDEGKLKPDAPDKYNALATAEWKKYYGNTDYMVGNILICSMNYVRH